MQNLFKLLFFTGVFPLILSLPRKYYLIKEEKSWSDAQAYCRANHTDLATIESVDDMLKLQGVAQSQQLTSGAWIGLYDDVNSWRWSYNNMSIESFEDWKDNEPNNDHGKEKCAITDNNEWLDKPCDDTNKVLCFDGQSTGNNWYIKVDTEMTWHTAQNYCRQHHTDLASAKDSAENDHIHQITGGHKFWIGLFRDSWKWSDQTKVSSVMWGSGEPNNAGVNCALLKAGEAEDEPCTDKMPFFCYSVITGQKQTIRVKVRSEQDGNDPEIQAAILEKIKDKLKELGIAENATVTWSKQPDGKVFRKEKKERKEK